MGTKKSACVSVVSRTVQILNEAVMGCIASKGDPGDSAPNLYRVWNVDEEGRILCPGYLELTGVELILHRRGGETIRWPTRCLRRYGFDSELFSFESGRRCPTGPGVYAFKCRRADELFNKLQEHVQACGQEEQSHGSGSMPRSSVSESIRPESENGLTVHRGSIRIPFSLSDNSITPAISPEYGILIPEVPRATTPRHDYVNSTAVEAETAFVCNGTDDNYAKLDNLLKQERLYINVKPEERCMTSYTNLLRMPRPMNYVVLDLDKNGAVGVDASWTTPTSPVSLTSFPESPEKAAEGYATIDFERTAALSCTNGNCVKDQSIRKTRHNSTISDLILSRHNSAVTN
uniref:IRS-type PTB domain-containing protein n=1 Tax=Strigamia maritima TaxID=126957 RepID=T1IHR3_STRMM